MQTTTGRSKDLAPEFETALAQYRHKIFIERLGWSLPVDDGLERDQFDHPETIYVVTREPDGAICGCARLLPTTEPYLLGEVFRHLMHNQPVPKSRDVWELSRFAAASVKADSAIDPALNTRALLAEAVHAAAAQGAKRLITVSPLGIERLLQRMGVHAHRAGPPMFAEGKPVFACWIEIDEQTLNALNISPSESMRGARMLQAVDRILSAVVESGLAMSPRHA